jgi:hypothetical protein
MIKPQLARRIPMIVLYVDLEWGWGYNTYYEVSDDGPNRRRRIVPADGQASISLATDSNIHWLGKTCTHGNTQINPVATVYSYNSHMG